MLDLIIFSLAWFVAGAINNLAGFGAAMVAMPILTIVLPMETAVVSAMPIIVMLNVQMAWAYRHNIPWSALRSVVIGGVVGVVAGLVIMETVPEGALKLTMGVFLVLYGMYSFFQWDHAGQMQKHSFWGAVAGFFSTLLGALFSFNGPPLAVYVTAGGWEQKKAKGLLGACFVLSGITILIGQVVSGAVTMETLRYSAIGVPAVLAGGGIGIFASRFVAQAVYRRIILMVIMTAGLSVIYSCL